MRRITRRLSLRLKNFRKGLNNFFEKNKIDDDELSVSQNVKLVDKGAPEVREGTAVWGVPLSSEIFLLANYLPAKNPTTQEVLIIQGGNLKKWSGTNWVTVGTLTFANEDANAVMYRNTDGDECLFIANKSDPITIYNGTSLYRYTALMPPTGVTATVGTGIAGTGFQYSYKVTAISPNGETQSSSAVVVNTNKARNEWNFDPSAPNINNSVLISWSAVTGAIGYNIYGVNQNYETFLVRVNSGTSWRDYGFKEPSIFFSAPTNNTTQAPRGDVIVVFKSALFIVDKDVPYRLWYSAGVDKPESFAVGDGGGYVDINSGGNDGAITALHVFSNNLIVFKERSIWQFDFTEGGLPAIRMITNDKGCINKYSVCKVENDLFFIGAKNKDLALYSLGYEPTFLNEIRTNEISIRARDTLIGVPVSQYNKISIAYIGGKVYIQLPDANSTANKKILVYDRERAAFSEYIGISAYRMQNILHDNRYKILWIDKTDNSITELNETYEDDKGQNINWVYETKHFDLELPMDYKRLHWVIMNFLNGRKKIKISVILDDNVYNIEHIVYNAVQNTHFGYAQFGVAQFATFNSVNPKFNNFIKLPIERLGQTSIVRKFALRIEGVDRGSNATLQDLEFIYKLMQNVNRNYEEIYQI